VDPSPHPFGCSIIIILRLDRPAMDVQPKKLVCVITFWVVLLSFFLLRLFWVVLLFFASIYRLFQLVTACVDAHEYSRHFRLVYVYI
jgi:uncharacterized Tic20 family protein